MTFQMMIDEEWEEAREAGREEMAVSAAIKMHRKGMPSEEIVEFTELS